MGIWRPLTDARKGLFFRLSDSLSRLESDQPDLLEPVSQGRMLIFSDYSGQHEEASHEAYSFLVTTDESVKIWLPIWARFRSELLPDNRRMSFKALNESLRYQALPAFLGTLSALRANLITVLIDRRIGGILCGGPEVATTLFPGYFPSSLKAGTIEKMLRVSGIVSLILSGLRRQNQESIWISDRDEALEDEDRKRIISRLIGSFTQAFAGWPNPANHFFGTIDPANAEHWQKDLISMADIVAGAYSSMKSDLLVHLSNIFSNPSPFVSGRIDDKRARSIANWLTIQKGSLKCILLQLESSGGNRVLSTAQARI